MSPIISRAGFSLGFGRRRGGAGPGPAVTQINDSYLFAPFNDLTDFAPPVFFF
jgi:hypothetical protein